MQTANFFQHQFHSVSFPQLYSLTLKIPALVDPATVDQHHEATVYYVFDASPVTDIPSREAGDAGSQPWNMWINIITMDLQEDCCQQLILKELDLLLADIDLLPKHPDHFRFVSNEEYDKNFSTDIMEIYDKEPEDQTQGDDNGFYIRQYAAVLPLVVGMQMIPIHSFGHWCTVA